LDEMDESNWMKTDDINWMKWMEKDEKIRLQKWMTEG